MALKIYAELTILTNFHKWSYSNDETSNFRSSAFTLDQIYLSKDITEVQRSLKKECLNKIKDGFALSEGKLDKAISDLFEEIRSNSKEPLPFVATDIINASKCLPEARLLAEPVSVDIIWNQPLIWRMLQILNRSQYFTIAAFDARQREVIEKKNFRKYYKAMMNRPLTHALHQVSQHSKPFRESVGTLKEAISQK